MNVKRNRTWLLLVISLILSIIFIFWGGVKNVAKIYGIVLLVSAILPIVPAILLTAKVRLPRIFTSGWTFILYLFWIIGLCISYLIRSWFGIVFTLCLFIIFLILGMVYALIKTLRSRKGGKYYYTDEEDNKTYEYDSFGQAYRKYLVDAIEYGLIDVILEAATSWWY